MAASIPLGSTTSTNPMNDLPVTFPPEDSVSSLAFSPNRANQQFLVAGSWDGSVRCWEVETSGNTVPKLLQLAPGPLLDVCWMDDGTKFFAAGSDGVARCWDLASNQAVLVASHDSPIKTCHWIQSSYYSCLMTGSWDKSLKFWDIRSPQAIRTICLPDRCFCADVNFPMAVVGTADNSLIVYQLEGGPQEYTRLDYRLKLQMRCLAIFRNKNGIPEGVAVGGIEGKVAIQYVHQQQTSFTFKCHNTEPAPGLLDIYVVNGIAFHPTHGTFATVGSDGRYVFWDKDAKAKLMISEFMDQSITTCSFSNSGHIFAYAVGYDWSKGHEYNDPRKKTNIFLRPCCEDLRPKSISNYKI